MAMLMISVMLVAIAGVIADAHRGYNVAFKRVYGDVVSDAYFSRMRFDYYCRKVCSGDVVIDPDIPMVYLKYYSTPNISGDAYLEPDSFVQFYLDGTDLIQACGPIATNEATDKIEVIARDVTELKFSADSGRAVQMVMTLDNGKESITVTCGSIRHN